MTIRVPTVRGRVTTGDIRMGAGVRGATWSDVAKLTNHVLGRGSMLIPAHCPDQGSGKDYSGGKKYILKYYVNPRYQTMDRHWAFLFRRDAANAGTVQIKVPSTASAVTYVTAGERERAQPIIVTEELGAQSGTAGVVDFEIWPEQSSTFLESVSCFEVPRAELDEYSDSDLGTDPTKFDTRNPGTAGSMAGFVNVLRDEDAIGRRGSLLQWAVPSTEDGSLTTTYASADATGSYVDMFVHPLPVLGRKIGRAAVTSTLRMHVYGWVSAGTGSVRVETTSGGVSSASTTTSTSAVWLSAIDFSVDCEDLASTDGRQTAASPAWDDIQINFKGVGGTFYIASVSIYEV